MLNRYTLYFLLMIIVLGALYHYEPTREFLRAIVLPWGETAQYCD